MSRTFDPRGLPPGRSARPARAAAPGIGAALLAAWAVAIASGTAARSAGSENPSERRPIDFRVFKGDKPVTGVWEFADPSGGAPRRIEIREVPGKEGVLTGVTAPGGAEVLSLRRKAEGLGFEGDLSGLLGACAQDRVAVSDFLPLGDRAMVRLDARPPVVPCPFLESPATSRWFVAPAASPVRLRAAGEITSERVREQIGLGGQPGGPLSPVVPGAVTVESGTEVRFLGRQRSLDGSYWIEVEGIVSPAVGIEPPRGYLPAEALRVAATLTLARPPAPPAPE